MAAASGPRPRGTAARLADPDGLLHRVILDNLADGVYYVDRRRRITYWNRGAEILTGYGATDVVGRRCFDDLLKHVDAEGHQLCADGCPLVATMSDGERRQVEVWLRHRDGSRRPVRVRTAPITSDGRVLGAVEIFDDATSLVETRQAMWRARHDALTDDLTGLANRRLFDLLLGARLEDRSRYGTGLGLLILDLDRFKDVNDRHGHQVGDDVLRAVAATLEGGVRAGDAVARWGGDEFGVLVGHASRGEMDSVAERLLALVASTEVRVADGELVGVSVSIGGASAIPDEPADALFGRADSALYEAKALGPGRYRFGGDEPAEQALASPGAASGSRPARASAAR
ncbi:MAG TPA: sensor domain-containing diguanylate cyclase [Candidatus Dormibacteraeota bacterium]|nr:sensor domain-containing diguanylate cyclase [Candidatus Dormibacteraeota bacterium]